VRIWEWIKNHQTQATIGTAATVAALLVGGLALMRDYFGWEAPKPNPSSAPLTATSGGSQHPPEPVPSPSPAGTSRLSTPAGTPPPARATDPADRTVAPAPTGDRKVSPPPRKAAEPLNPETAEELRFTLSAAGTTANTVEVVPDASGQAEAGRTYWFMIETDWGNGNIDYFPRRQVSATTPAFEVSIPPDADLKYARHGRIYALTGSESAQAEIMRQHQQEQAGGTVRHDTYFTNPTGQIASNAVRLPF
jgi:hypothetical protein